VTSDDLQVFQAILRTGSLVAAAKALAVDRTTVARRLDQLEERVRVPLFVRTRSGLTPTTAAHQLGDQADRILRELREIESLALANDTGVRGTVRIATTEGLAGHLIRRGILGLSSRFPELVIDLLTGNQVIDVEAGEADLALRTAVTRGEGVRVRKIATLSVGLNACATYLRTRGTPTTLAALAGHDLLVTTTELARLPETRIMTRVKGARIVLRSASVPLLVEAAIAGAGIIALPGAWAEAAGLQRIMTLEGVPPRPMWLATAPGARERAAVRVVGDEIARMFADFH
jgi:DNA-binding transcriptional LysR family regulator